MIMKAAKADPITAAKAFSLNRWVPVTIVPQDWPDILAADLLEDPNRRLQDWAEQHPGPRLGNPFARL